MKKEQIIKQLEETLEHVESECAAQVLRNTIEWAREEMEK